MRGSGDLRNTMRSICWEFMRAKLSPLCHMVLKENQGSFEQKQRGASENDEMEENYVKAMRLKLNSGSAPPSLEGKR